MKNQEKATVRVLLPLLEKSSDIEVDQTEQVIVNGQVTSLHRGEYVDIKPEVFLELRKRYPNL